MDELQANIHVSVGPHTLSYPLSSGRRLDAMAPDARRFRAWETHGTARAQAFGLVPRGIAGTKPRYPRHVDSIDACMLFSGVAGSSYGLDASRLKSRKTVYKSMPDVVFHTLVGTQPLFQ